MYTAIILVLIAVAGFFLMKGIKSNRNLLIFFGVAIAGATAFLFWWMGFYAEFLWFEALGYGKRFWTEMFARAGLAVAGTLLGAGLAFLLTLPVRYEKRLIRYIATAIGAFSGFGWGAGQWEALLKFYYAVDAGIAEPILGIDAGFYLFRLPFLDGLQGLLLFIGFLALAANFVNSFVWVVNNKVELRIPDDAFSKKGYRGLYFSAAYILPVLAAGAYLQRFHLLYSQLGVVAGPGWTDVNLRMPGFLIMSILMLLAAVALLIPTLRARIGNSFSRARTGFPTALLAVGGGLIVLWVIILVVLPGVLQWLRVQPNEITFERPYIINNIALTRHGFNLHKAEDRQFPAEEKFTREMVENNPHLFNNVRLWDWRALDAVYKQFQEIRLYYEFTDVDIDRYTYDGNYRQVMVSAREMNTDNLPLQSRTFVNKRFKYTHGHGITLANVNEFTPEGLPNLLIKDIPPKHAYPELEVTRPEIYYGGLTYEHVVVNSTEAEFDYPQGDQNRYTHYKGTGGVEISNLWRKFLFGWKFDGTRLFLSEYITDTSRIMYNRQVQQRVQKLAPFLRFDEDPYIVLHEGRLSWIIDAYTTSEYFPYSQPFSSNEMIQYNRGEARRITAGRGKQSLNGINYIRNSVKAVVDAYTGEVNMYIFDDEDPLIKVWDRIFPGLFKPRSSMPKVLESHIRYPLDMLLVQGLVYARYHMGDPSVFYNQEDLWIRATEKYYGSVQPVEPYYVMWEMPDTDQPEFVLILPFTPKKRQVLIGWIAGMCDPGNYGRLLVYKFPKDRHILGPQQVETKIDQDRFLAQQLTLWDQRGSNVIRGNVLAIPVDNTLFYVEPIYLQAETAAYPELRLVVVMHGDNISYANTFKEALEGIFTEGSLTVAKITDDTDTTETRKAGPTVEGKASELIEKAGRAFRDYQRHTGEGNFEEASKALKELQQALEQLEKER